MDQHILVDNQEPVMELVRVLHRERIAVLRVEGGHIGGVEQFAFRVSHDRAVMGFAITICDFKSSVSDLTNRNMNRSGKRLLLRLTA